jgi:hypothetical protein
MHEILNFFLGLNQYLTGPGQDIGKISVFRFRPGIRIFTISALPQHTWKQFFDESWAPKNWALFLVPLYWFLIDYFYKLLYDFLKSKTTFLTFFGSYCCPVQIFLNSMLYYKRNMLIFYDVDFEGHLLTLCCPHMLQVRALSPA